MDKEQQQKPLDEQTANINAEEKNKEDAQTNDQQKHDQIDNSFGDYRSKTLLKGNLLIGRQSGCS